MSRANARYPDVLVFIKTTKKVVSYAMLVYPTVTGADQKYEGQVYKGNTDLDWDDWDYEYFYSDTYADLVQTAIAVANGYTSTGFVRSEYGDIGEAYSTLKNTYKKFVDIKEEEQKQKELPRPRRRSLLMD